MPTAGGGAGLRVARVLSRDFDGRSETSLDPDLRVFVSDLVRPYGLPLREDLLRAGVGHAYGEMGEALLREALAPDEQVDLLILAFDIPDVQPGRSASVHLSRFCPGAPLAFAICDQGPAAAFTALRIASDYSRTGGCRRAVVLAMEQTALHHRPEQPVQLPERHRAVVLVCEQSEEGGAELTVRQHSGPDVDRELIPSGLKELGPDAELLLASDLGPGQPLTGVWTELAARLPVWQRDGRPALVAQLDPGRGRLSLLALPAPP
ncbi:hypothetical protein ACEZDB_17300 [Streptacidiphilus sp. N1-3]|uniref:Uncharacterized protein n=1 Tax=Streptacidiphilus alkalitolerans TaxID=3342712 RepID=A0ABV6X294_9ACTN